MSAPTERQNIVIIGTMHADEIIRTWLTCDLGGSVIGCTIAHYLTHHPRFDPSLYTIIIVEAAEVGNGASGKASDLLASWALSSQLAGLSFDLHDQLEKEHNVAVLWDHHRVHSGQSNFALCRLMENIKLQSRKEANVPPHRWGWGSGDLNWFNADNAQAYEELTDMNSTTQIDPFHFTIRSAKLAEEGGADIIKGQVAHANYSIVHSSSDVRITLSSFQDLARKRIVSMTYIDKVTSTILTATVVLAAAGPWTPTPFSKVRISPLRIHSVTIKIN
jgi:hypothetical protein